MSKKAHHQHQAAPAAQPRPRLSDEQIKIIAKHAAEGTELQARQHNERVELMERQRDELIKAGLANAPGVLSPLGTGGQG